MCLPRGPTPMRYIHSLVLRDFALGCAKEHIPARNHTPMGHMGNDYVYCKPSIAPEAGYWRETLQKQNLIQ